MHQPALSQRAANAEHVCGPENRTLAAMQLLTWSVTGNTLSEAERERLDDHNRRRKRRPRKYDAVHQKLEQDEPEPSASMSLQHTRLPSDDQSTVGGPTFLSRFAGRPTSPINPSDITGFVSRSKLRKERTERTLDRSSAA